MAYASDTSSGAECHSGGSPMVGSPIMKHRKYATTALDVGEPSCWDRPGVLFLFILKLRHFQQSERLKCQSHVFARMLYLHLRLVR